MLIIQKFGGTSVATPALIQTCADHAQAEFARGNRVVVVVSAMAGVTDQLDAYVREISLAPSMREYDVVVSSGEQVTCGLMAIALRARGLPAVSNLGWQVPVRTCATFGHSRIEEVDPTHLQRALDQGLIPVVAGFQGVTVDGELTTFGRGGSDITAVALAVSLGAERCDLYKDVPGILTADPRVVPKARLIPVMTGQEMLELSSLGAKVLQPRAVQMALNLGARLRILSTFEPGSGTLIDLQENPMEKALVRALVCQKSQTHVAMSHGGQISELLKALERAHIGVDMISFVKDELVMSLNESQADQAQSLLSQVVETPVTLVKGLAKVSLVGNGLRAHAEILRTVFDLLDERKIAVHASCVSETRMSLLIDEVYAELVVRLLHSAFDLDKEEYHAPHLKSA